MARLKERVREAEEEGREGQGVWSVRGASLANVDDNAKANANADGDADAATVVWQPHLL